MKAKDIVKSVAKKTDLTPAKSGSDPYDAWSSSGAGGGLAIPENVTSRRAELLSRYYKSKGWNVNYIPKNTKVSQSKKGDYEKWKRDHGIYEDEVNEDLTTKISHPEIRSTISQSPTLKRKKQLDKAGARYEVPTPAGTMKKESLGDDFLKMMKDKGIKHRVHGTTDQEKQRTMDKLAANKAQSDVAPKKKAEPGTFGTTRGYGQGRYMGDSVELEGEQIDEITLGSYPSKNRKRTLSPQEIEKIKKALEREKKNTVPGQLKQNEPKYKRDNYKKDTTLNYFSKIGEEQVNEVGSELLGRYKEKAKKSADDLTAAGKHRQATDRHMNVMKATGKQMAHTISNLKKSLKQEDNFGDPKAASEAPFDMGNNPDDVAPKKKMSKAASMVKEIYAKHKLKEDMYDWEKDQKDAKPMGKKPTVQKVDGSNELGDKKPKARMVLKGGTTLTGEKRDMVEIDPMLKNRTAIPDYKDMDKKQKPQEQ